MLLVAVFITACGPGGEVISPPPAGPGGDYEAGHYNHRIVRMEDLTGKGWTTLGSRGSSVNQFHSPLGLFVDGAGRIYVTDARYVAI